MRYPIGSHKDSIPREKKPKKVKDIEISMITVNFSSNFPVGFTGFYDLYHVSITKAEWNIYSRIFEKLKQEINIQIKNQKKNELN